MSEMLGPGLEQRQLPRAGNGFAVAREVFDERGIDVTAEPQDQKEKD